MAETTEKVLERLKNDLPERYDMSPGSYTYDVEMPVAKEFENAYDKLDNKESQFYAITATGTYLDNRVSEFGLTRKDATSATGYVTIKGDVGAVVNAGDRVAAGNIIFNITDSATIDESGIVTVPVVCAIQSSSGNVSAGAINRFPVTISGLVSVSNEDATTGGSDKETDNELRARFIEFVSHPITSGNKYQYISWAKSVEGVGDAKCQPLWNGNGTVKVIIVGTEKQIAGTELINKVQSYIDEQCPIGAAVTVTTADEKNIDISCTLTADSDVEENIKEYIKTYLRDVSFQQGYISYAKIGQVILNTPGVTDYTDLTVNGGMVNIEIAETEIAVLGVVNLD